MSDNSISIFDFLTKHETVVNFNQPVGGHGGGDNKIMRQFIDSIRHESKHHISSAEVSLRSHLMAFAAEESRLNQGKSIDLDHFYHDVLHAK